jgi:hypothetical protein
MLKQEASFRELKTLRTSSFQYCLQAISASVYLPSQDHPWSIPPSFISVSFKSKDCNQKELYIKDSWRSLYESIYSAIDGDQDLLGLFYSTQKNYIKFAWTASKPLTIKFQVEKNSRTSLLEEFTENRTSYLALNNIQKTRVRNYGKATIESNYWNGMDSNPFSNVSWIQFIHELSKQ